MQHNVYTPGNTMYIRFNAVQCIYPMQHNVYIEGNTMYNVRCNRMYMRNAVECI